MGEYFVKHSYGIMRHFCHNSRGICFCNMTDANTTEYEILVDNGQRDFDVIIDDSDTIHLVCQDDKGNILYIKNNGKDWEKYTLLQSKTPSSHLKSFNLLRVGKWINIIYSIDYKGKKMLTHHILENSDVPTAIDYIDGEFCTAKDESGNIYVLYTNYSGSLGWRKFVWSKKEWGDFIPVSTSGRLIQPYIFVDDRIHITGVIEENAVYLNEGGETTVGTNAFDPIFIKHSGILNIMWKNKKDGRVWCCSSTDDGGSFQAPTEFMAGRFAPSKLFSLAYTTFEACQSRHCYGYIRDNAATLYLLSDFLKISRIPPKPMPTLTYPVQSNDETELEKLKIQLRMVSDSLAKITSRVEKLESSLETTDEFLLP